MERTQAGISLELWSGGALIFSSALKWLHPLLELEQFLEGRGLDRQALRLRDKIVGKAAALLIVRLGIPDVHAGILSLPGKEVFSVHGIRFSYGRLVSRVACRTEELLADIRDPDAAHLLILERARAAGTRSATPTPGAPA